MSKKRSAVAATEADGRLTIRISTKYPKHNHRAPDVNPDWLFTVSALKLRRLWRSRDRVYFHSDDIRKHIKIYGVDRFFAEHRDEILFGDDIHNDRQALLATLAEDERRVDRLALTRLFTRLKREKRPIRVSEPPAYVSAEYNVRVVKEDRVLLTEVGSVGVISEFTYGTFKTLNKQCLRFGKRVRVPFLVSEAEIARCKRLDAIEAAVFGAESEAKHGQRLRGCDPAYTPPPIARFVNSPLFDKNVWGLIAKMI